MLSEFKLAHGESSNPTTRASEVRIRTPIMVQLDELGKGERGVVNFEKGRGGV